jgi:hypothetical protein
LREWYYITPKSLVFGRFQAKPSKRKVKKLDVDKTTEFGLRGKGLSGS